MMMNIISIWRLITRVYIYDRDCISLLLIIYDMMDRWDMMYDVWSDDICMVTTLTYLFYPSTHALSTQRSSKIIKHLQQKKHSANLPRYKISLFIMMFFLALSLSLCVIGIDARLHSNSTVVSEVTVSFALLRTGIGSHITYVILISHMTLELMCWVLLFSQS